MRKPGNNTCANRANTMRLSTKSTNARAVCSMPPSAREFKVHPQLKPIMSGSMGVKPRECHATTHAGVLPNCKINQIK